MDKGSQPQDLQISVIVPCFNEQEVIATTHRELKRVLGNLKSPYEILYINDGSSDNTLELLQRISQNDENSKLISFSRNFGHQAAVSAGISNCSGDVAIIIDADLQDPPELFGKMIALHKKGYNVVYGVRKERVGESHFKKATAKFFYRLLNFLSDTDLPLDTGDFRLIDRKVIEAFKSLNEKNKYIRGLITWIGFKSCPIYYKREPRKAGVTKYPIGKMLKFATTGLLYFSKKPLYLALFLGFLSIFIGLLLVIYVFISKYLEPSFVVQGWASTAIIIIFFGGVQLLTIGVIGYYIGNIFDEIRGRPEYIIENKFNFTKPDGKNKQLY